jgi:hypothetical protein
MKSKPLAALLTIIMLMPVFAFAQYGGYCPPSSAPVDGGLSLLLGVGAVSYGAKKVAEKRKAAADRKK